MSRFDTCLEFVLAREGKYSNNPADRGGATNQGITQVNYDAWRVAHGLSRKPVLGISGAEVSEIYTTGYWQPVRANELVPPLDLCLFDAAVQHGPRRAIKWIQRVVGAMPDGVLGPKTLTLLALLIERDGLDAVINDYMAIRDGFYHEIVANDISQAVFLKGWMNRMDALREAVE